MWSAEDASCIFKSKFIHGKILGGKYNKCVMNYKKRIHNKIPVNETKVS